LISSGKTLGDLFDNAKEAEELITSLQDTAAKVVHGDIEAYRKIWGLKEKTERDTLVAQATSWATRQADRGEEPTKLDIDKALRLPTDGVEEPVALR
jgi:hypothetical protein